MARISGILKNRPMRASPDVRSLLNTLDRWRFSTLLGMLLIAIFLQPILHGRAGGPSIMIVLFALIFSAAIRATQPTTSVSNLGFGIAMLWAGLSLLAIATDGTWLDGFAVFVTILLAALITWRTLERLFIEQRADRDTLAGAVFGYFLMAVLWSELYRAIELWQPGSFSLSGDSGIGSEMLYLSLVTITTLGYGDILPLSPFARILAGIEAAFGTLYIAILIGRIVGALRRPSHGSSGSDRGAPESEG